MLWITWYLRYDNKESESIMAAAATDKLMEVGLPGSATTLSAPGYTIGATSINVGSTTNWPTATGVAFAIDVVTIVDGEQVRTAGTYNEFVGTVTNGTTIGNVTQVFGTAQNYAAGSLTRVYIPVSSERENRIVEWGTAEHNQNGTHAAITATSITATTGTFTNLTIAGVEDAAGWSPFGQSLTNITALGNRSYTAVVSGTDTTGTTSVGQRLKLPRTVTAPTQCTDLEASSSQYFSKTSPSGLSFTTTFTCSAWIKLESYTEGGIIARRNADTEGWHMHIDSTGRVVLGGLRVAVNNKSITSYQSVPLNKWVHVAATLDMAVGDTSAQKIWIDGVEVPRQYVLTGTASALVQGTTALVVGAIKSAGTNPFDGKIAQAAVFSSQLSDATIKAMANQTMTGAESTVCAAYTLSNSLLDLTANDNDLTASGSALATNTDTPFTNDVTGTSVTAGTTNYGIIMAQTFSTNTTYTIQVPEGETLPTTGGVGTVSYSAQSNPYGWPSSANKRIGTVLLQGSSPTATALTQILGMTQTFTADANKEYKITVQPGASMTLSGSGATSAMSIWDGTVGSGTQLMESHVTSAGTNYGAATSVWWTGKLSAGSHTINLGLRAIGAGTTTLGVAVVTPAIFTIEEVV
jgi:hypothetical protein